MVSRSPDQAERPLAVLKRDGRRVRFDAARLLDSLQRALHAAGHEEPSLARDLRGVIEAYVEGHAVGGVVSAVELAELAQAVLRGAGCEAAALAYARAREARTHARGRLRIRTTAAHEPVRGIPAGEDGAAPADAPELRAEDPEAWSKARVAALLAVATELPPATVAAIAADVERGLLASGLSSIGAGLLREWVDNELVLRGHPPRLGAHHFVGLAPHELRGILADGAAGLGAESEVSRRLFTRYALTEVYPPAVRAAHEQGLLGLENLACGGRLDVLALAPWRLPALGADLAPARRRRQRALGPLVRTLAHLVSREVLLEWDGPALSAEPLADLLVQLADGAPAEGGAARVVVCLPPERAGLAAAFLAAFESLRRSPLPGPARLPWLRLPAGSLSPEHLDRAVRLEEVDGRLQFAAGVPAPGVVTASVAVNLGRLALDAGPRRVHEFLEALDATVDLALSALAAQEALMGGADAPRRALARATGVPASGWPCRQRLALSGATEAARVLLGDSARGRANRVDLAAAIGERLAVRLRDRAPEVRIGLPAPATAERFGRLDLSAFPAGRDLLSLCSSRDGYRYDGALVLAPGTDGAEAGAEAGRVRQRLGLDAEGPVPRCTGSTEQRLAFLPAFLGVSNPVPDLNPCG